MANSFGQHGGIEKFREVAVVCRPGVFRFALATLRDRDAAENITQECFLRACHAWPGFRGNSSPQTWLIAIAVNLIRDARRCRHREFPDRPRQMCFTRLRAEVMPDPASSPEGRWLAKERVIAVRKAVMADLSPKQRTIFLLHFVREMSVAEIGAAMKMRSVTVRVHLSRAVRIVRQKLDRM